MLGDLTLGRIVDGKRHWSLRVERLRGREKIVRGEKTYATCANFTYDVSLSLFTSCNQRLASAHSSSLSKAHSPLIQKHKRRCRVSSRSRSVALPKVARVRARCTDLRHAAQMFGQGEDVGYDIMGRPRAGGHLRRPPVSDQHLIPRTDVYDSKEKQHIVMELPGIKSSEDIDVSIHGWLITLVARSGLVVDRRET